MSNLNPNLKKMGNYASIALLVIGITLIIAEFFVHRHGEIALEDLPLFPATVSYTHLTLPTICSV